MRNMHLEVYMADTKVTGSQEDFVEEKARELLVGWADYQVRFGTLIRPVTDAPGHMDTWAAPMLVEPYMSAAVGKGWISVKGDVPKVLAKGFAAAAAYLRR